MSELQNTIQRGSSIRFLRDSEPPLRSRNTKLVAALLVCGYRFAHREAFLDATEIGPDGFRKRIVTWSMLENQEVEFNTINGKEMVSLAEFTKRWGDREWQAANPDHPITYLRYAALMQEQLNHKIKTIKPMILIRTGRQARLIPTDHPDAARHEALANV